MGAAGFDFKFRAKNGEMTIRGECNILNDGSYKITKKDVATISESRQRIKELLR
tara:strand:+ start:431 stop:592 length:162 start_codon:yes stop_codon:yes gene_type:complete